MSFRFSDESYFLTELVLIGRPPEATRNSFGRRTPSAELEMCIWVYNEEALYDAIVVRPHHSWEMNRPKHSTEEQCHRVSEHQILVHPFFLQPWTAYTYACIHAYFWAEWNIDRTQQSTDYQSGTIVRASMETVKPLVNSSMAGQGVT